jgi:hypothetical protein
MFSFRGSLEVAMNKSMIVTAMLLAAFSTSAFAQSSKSDKTPGHLLQEKGPVPGSPGASGYAPGHKMQKKGWVKGTTGASRYAPGRATTGVKTRATTGVKTDVDVDIKAKSK